MNLCMLKPAILAERNPTHHIDQTRYHRFHFYTNHMFWSSFHHKTLHHTLVEIKKKTANFVNNVNFKKVILFLNCVTIDKKYYHKLVLHISQALVRNLLTNCATDKTIYIELLPDTRFQ